MFSIEKLISYITLVNKWVAFATLVFMMVSVSYFAIGRSMGHPVLGDVELVQFSMVIVIMCAMPFTEKTNSHIAIGIIVDKLPHRVQTILDILSHLLTLIFSILVALFFVMKLDVQQSSDLLRISYTPFKLIIVCGFTGWALEALVKLVQSISRLNNKGVMELENERGIRVDS
ncbi:TRAP transporter small permease [Mesobacillus maritimus]|uniref:TRAP transporter small permease n=1 Tax=Mesobacillus maritimus TaxID=1643336 RepID=UPI00384DD3A5